MAHGLGGMCGFHLFLAIRAIDSTPGMAFVLALYIQGALQGIPFHTKRYNGRCSLPKDDCLSPQRSAAIKSNQTHLNTYASLLPRYAMNAYLISILLLVPNMINAIYLVL